MIEEHNMRAKSDGGMFSRQADEMILTMLRMQDDGVKLSEIARRLGVGKGKVIGAMRRIREEDLG